MLSSMTMTSGGGGFKDLQSSTRPPGEVRPRLMEGARVEQCVHG